MENTSRHTVLKEPALKAAKVIKEAWKVKIFSLSSCRDALILHGQKLRSLGCCITCLHLLRPIEAEHTLQIFFTYSCFFFQAFLHYVTQQFSKKRGKDSG